MSESVDKSTGHAIENKTSSVDSDDIDTLVAQLRDAHYRVRLRAVRALGKLGDVRLIPQLLIALGEFDPEDEESRVNFSACDALVALGEPALVPLLDELKRVENIVDADERNWKRYFITETLNILHMELGWHKPDAIHKGPPYTYYRKLLERERSAAERADKTILFLPLSPDTTTCKHENRSMLFIISERLL
jgi:hypothetical protein